MCIAGSPNLVAHHAPVSGGCCTYACNTLLLLPHTLSHAVPAAACCCCPRSGQSYCMASFRSNCADPDNAGCDRCETCLLLRGRPAREKWLLISASTCQAAGMMYNSNGMRFYKAAQGRTGICSIPSMLCQAHGNSRSCLLVLHFPSGESQRHAAACCDLYLMTHSDWRQLVVRVHRTDQEGSRADPHSR